MEDIQILKQLLDGNHLEPTELERASKLLFFLKVQIKGRL
jgi:hypothetical protein